jgi:hypothetical protein
MQFIVLPNDGPIRPKHVDVSVFLNNITVSLTQMCAFVGLNYSNNTLSSGIGGHHNKSGPFLTTHSIIKCHASYIHTILTQSLFQISKLQEELACTGDE